ncbi:unnamed protein product [Ostreobium quekettii]|uniref:PX domain-containing protein n=1 Tax=Ostreobium quekettii TaxID=121088 RepID=A0A8S1JAL1_9CHLO|nr:unnamed protein product [Ostreobium quekettii]|eukprot:evm.model.scf_211.4 EVM.evm.TU.scf_211.4   scf_211:38841-42981(+)
MEGDPLATPGTSNGAGSRPAGQPPAYESVVMADAVSSSSLAAGRDSNYRKSSEFEITVTDPVKQGERVAAYVTYKVRSKTSMSQYKQGSSEVIRRFRDFAWLYDKLHERYKGIIIPPLPEKNAVQKYQMSTEFIEQRRRGLQIFVNRVAAHPKLKYSNELQLFLEATEDVWMMEVARMNQESGGAKKTINNTMQFFKDLGHSATNLMAGKSDDEEEDPDYLKVREYLVHLESHLIEAHRQSARLIRKQGELGIAVGEFGQAAEKLGKFEEGSLQDAFVHLGNHAGDLSTVSRDSANSLSYQFEAPLKEFTRMMKSVRAVMADRTNALSFLQQAKADLDAKRVKMNKLKSTPGIKEEKVVEAERERDQADLRLQNARAAYETIVERMNEELARFQKERAVEMSQVLRDFALAQAQLASETARSWSSLVTELQPAAPA